MEQPTDNPLRSFNFNVFEFNCLLSKFLPREVGPWWIEKFDEFKDKFKSLTDAERDHILSLLKLGDRETIYIKLFRSLLPADPSHSSTVDDVFCALVITVVSIPPLIPRLGTIQSRSQSLTARLAPGHDRGVINPHSVVLIPDGHLLRNPTVVLTHSDVVDAVRPILDSVVHESDEFDRLFFQFLPEKFLAFYFNNVGGFKDKFKSLTDLNRHQILTFLRKRSHGSIRYFRQVLINVGQPTTTVDSVFRVLYSTAALYFHLVLTDESGLSLCHPHFVYPSFASSTQPGSQSPAASLCSPLAGDRADGIHWAIGDPGASSSSSSSASPSPAEASVNNPPANVGDTIIPVGAELTSGHQEIPAEARATRDDKTAGLSKCNGELVSVNHTTAEKAFKILKSTYHSTKPFPIKTFGYLTVVLSVAAFLLSLVGLLLNTFKPNTSPSNMPSAVIHITVYAFIGVMCYEYLQDDTFLMCIVAGLTLAFFNAIMWYVGRRR